MPTLTLPVRLAGGEPVECEVVYTYEVGIDWVECWGAPVSMETCEIEVVGVKLDGVDRIDDTDAKERERLVELIAECDDAHS